MGHNDSYSTITSQILITKQLPVLNKAYSLIKLAKLVWSLNQQLYMLTIPILRGFKAIKVGIKVEIIGVKLERVVIRRKRGLFAHIVELWVM